jgi:hypothetical protein
MHHVPLILSLTFEQSRSTNLRKVRTRRRCAEDLRTPLPRKPNFGTEDKRVRTRDSDEQQWVSASHDALRLRVTSVPNLQTTFPTDRFDWPLLNVLTMVGAEGFED